MLSLRRIPKSRLAAGFLFLGCLQFCCSQRPTIQVNRNQAFDVAHRDFSRPRQPAERFLGWKYAALAKQDTSRWIRPTKSPAPNHSVSIGSLETEALSSAASSSNSFVDAGFASPAKLPTGFLPTAVIQGDFNGDGNMDLAICNGGDNTIYVYLGNGDGTFAIPEVLFTTGQSPVWLAAAQLRASGHLDLIAVDGDSNQVEVFSGNGDGTFRAPMIVASLNQTPTFVLAGDFNKDGITDLAVGLVVASNAMQPQFEVLIGDGTGAFPSAITPPLVDNESDSPLPTSWLASGDVDKDGLPDLVITVAFEGALTYLNRGGSAFQPGDIFNPGDGAVAVGLGDMNGDGCLDAVETGGYGWLTIAKGNCNGTFTQNGFTAELGDVDYAVTVADVNGDGKLDVVASSAFSEDEVVGGIGAVGGYLVSVLDGDGAGNVSPPSIYRVGADAFSLAVSDLSGDGFPDIVTINQHESSTSLLLNDGKGGFGSPSGEAVGYIGGVSNAPNSLATPQTVDVNGDGKPDVVLMEYGQNSTLANQVAVLLNDGTGKLEPPIRSPITVGPNIPDPVFVAANFRSANKADLIYVSTYESDFVVAFMPGNGDGTFGTATTLATLPDPYLVAAGDFNGDGKLDFAVLGYANPGTPETDDTWELDVFLGNGDGTFRHLSPQTFPALTTTAFPYQLIAGDFNHDGKLDLLIGSNANGGWVASGDDLDLALGNGDGTFQTPTTLFAHFGPVAVADLNNDGYLDLVQARDPNADTTQDALNIAGGSYFTPAITIYLGGPGGVFTKQATYYAPGLQFASTFPALVGHFEGSGNLDVALLTVQSTLTGPGNQFIQIFQGNGTGAFTPNGITYQLPLYDYPVVGGDFRGVGLTDMLDLVGSTSSINTISASPGPALDITPDSSPLTGNQGSATVTLALPTTSNETVELSSSDPAVTLPGSITFSPGESEQSFSFTVGPGFNSSRLLAITGNLAGQSAVAYFAKANQNLNPAVTAYVGGTVFPTTSVITFPGGSIPLFLTLQSVDGYSGTFGQFACTGLPAGAACDFSQSIVVLMPGGYAQVTFNLTTGSSSPVGSYALSILASNGVVSASAPLTLDVGGFALSANPTLVQINGPNAPNTTLMAAFSSFFNQSIFITCNGLPAGASCSGGTLTPQSPSQTVTLGAQASVPAQDYPFQIAATYDNASTSVNATLRVSTFSAVLQTNSATIASGKSATFNVEFASLNHFSNSQISLSCRSLSNVVCSTASLDASLTYGGTATLALIVSPPSSTIATSSHMGAPWKVVAACFVLLIFSPTRSSTWRRRFLHVVALLILVSTISACGGGGNGTGGGVGGGGSPQTYSMAVTAQATTGSGTLQVPVGTITLTVTQ